MAVTHDMIAVKLGINRTTVTKALKGDLSIKESTRKSVLEIATAMDYDFKQSQQNRREGKRYYSCEKVELKLIDQNNKRNSVTGTGKITNLSATGLLITLDNTLDGKVPLAHLNVEIVAKDKSALSKLPLAKLVRINYLKNIECAAKFDKKDYLPEDVLLEIEKQSFKLMDKKTKTKKTKAKPKKK